LTISSRCDSWCCSFCLGCGDEISHKLISLVVCRTNFVREINPVEFSFASKSTLFQRQTTGRNLRNFPYEFRLRINSINPNSTSRIGRHLIFEITC